MRVCVCARAREPVQAHARECIYMNSGPTSKGNERFVSCHILNQLNKWKHLRGIITLY